MEGAMMVDESDLEGLPVQSMLRATITGRTFAEGGLIGRLCQRMLAEGATRLDPAVGEDEIKARIRSIVSWYRATRDPWWSNGAFSEWIRSQDLTLEEVVFSIFAAMAICTDRALVSALRGRDVVAEEWFSCAVWLNYFLFIAGRYPDSQAYDKELTAKLFEDAMRQKSNLALGPVAASKKRIEKANEKRNRLDNAIKELFDKPEKPGWAMTNPDIVNFLLKRGNWGYADSVVLGRVKNIAAECREDGRKKALAQCATG